ncbi:expansin-B3 [Citrus sinensis]|uniref:Expansin-B3 n=1 Tax=Citrus sinensis TaxID=2711 RepID=A0ACB8N492_CITSI|nr:expansin-B3 [Citrus sinensis]
MQCQPEYSVSQVLTFFLLLAFKCSVVAPTQLNHQLSEPHWLPATATWYGSPEGDGSDGGACGYGSLVDVKPLRARVGAVSPVLFKNGGGCGACYKVRCLDKSICSRRAVTIIVTDECPGGYCSNGRTHFDLSGAAFGRMAIAGESGELRNRGELPVIYRRAPCKYPGKNIAFHVNEGSTDYWLSLLVEFEDGDGDVGSMHIREVNFVYLLNFYFCLVKHFPPCRLRQ